MKFSVHAAKCPDPLEAIAGRDGSTLLQQFENKLGGRVKVQCDYSVGSSIEGTASTGWLDNTEENTANVSLILFQTPITLTEHSTYEHTSLLTYQHGAYQWMNPAPAPTSRMPPPQAGNAISQFNGLALSQRHGQLGYAWEAVGLGLGDCAGGSGGGGNIQLHALQNVDVPGVPMADARFSGCGYSARTTIVYDPYPAQFLMRDGQFVVGSDGRPVPDPADVDRGAYFIDPLLAQEDLLRGGGYHLRKIDLGSAARGTPLNQPRVPLSYGRFQFPVDSAVIHPSGRIVALNRSFAKISVTTLERKGRPDLDVPLAANFAGRGLNYRSSGARAGLLIDPIAVASTYDGTIVVLENTISAGFSVARLQAFDVNGNPVNAFGNKKTGPSPFFELPVGPAYLDLAVVGGSDLTYFYLLSHKGSDSNNYTLSVYQYGTNAGTANPLVTTMTDPDFSNAVMPHVDFSGSTFRGVTFRGSSMENTSFREATFTVSPSTSKGVDLACTQLGGVDFTNLTADVVIFLGAVLPPRSQCLQDSDGTYYCGTEPAANQPYGPTILPTLSREALCPPGQRTTCNATSWLLPDWKTTACNADGKEQIVWTPPTSLPTTAH